MNFGKSIFFIPPNIVAICKCVAQRLPFFGKSIEVGIVDKVASRLANARHLVGNEQHCRGANKEVAVRRPGRTGKYDARLFIKVCNAKAIFWLPM